MDLHPQILEEQRESAAVAKMAVDDGRVYTFNAAALRAWVAHRRPDLNRYVEQILTLGSAGAYPEAGLELCLAIGFTAGRKFERGVVAQEDGDLRALLQKCARVLDRCLVEWCDGCGRKRTTPGPCPHCSADGRHVSTTADAPDHLHCLAAELRAAGVEPTP